MRTFKILVFLVFCSVGKVSFAQELPSDIATALQNDDTAQISAVVTGDNINNCYGHYSLLSEAIRDNAENCFNLLIAKGADVNKICNGYVPPLMHAVKYDHLDMVKVLIQHGADKNFVYNGEDMSDKNGPAKGETPLSYADKYHRDEIAAYLKSLQ